jgi:tRNA-specific 2-thiouridylase
VGDKKRILVAMSGGVDSSVVAWLLREEGHDVAGAFMSRGAAGGQVAGGPAVAVDNARRVAEFLEIPFHVLDLAESFDMLIDYFSSEYLRGRTPNPCAICNPQIKFRKLLELADSLGMSHLATGHYARLEHAQGRSTLRRGLDPGRDQSYYLFALPQRFLARSMFPLGERFKPDVREIARKAGLPSAETEDSQDICFVPDGEYPRLVRERLGAKVKPGDIVDVQGNVVGRHEGIVDFTIGQRRGVRVAMGEPVYVVDIDASANRVVIGPADRLLVGEFTVENVNWVSAGPPTEPLRAGVQIRYHSKPQSATVTLAGRYSVHVKFDEPQRAVTPGQCAVFYDNDLLLGGGWISRSR